MNVRLIGYWIATIVIGLETAAGGVTDLIRGRTALVFGPFVQDLITHLGYPPYVLAILGFWKVVGAVVVLAPGMPRLKEWAYAGVLFELTGAAASFALHGDRATEMVSPVFLAIVAVASWGLRPPSRTLGVLTQSRVAA